MLTPHSFMASKSFTLKQVKVVANLLQLEKLKEVLVATLKEVKKSKAVELVESGLSALNKKWKHALDDGFTAIPNVIFKHQKELALTHLDVLIILHLSSFWWEANNFPHPAKSTIADSLNVLPRTVQGRIKKMEVQGYIRRIPRKAKPNKDGAESDNLSNKYDLSGLVKECERIAKNNVALRVKRQESDRKLITSPNSSKLKVVA